MEELQLLLLLL